MQGLQPSLPISSAGVGRTQYSSCSRSRRLADCHFPKFCYAVALFSIPTSLLKQVNGVSLKSIQVWSGRNAGAQAGDRRWGLPRIYAATVDGGDASSGARASIGTWTFIGCYQATGLSSAGHGHTPRTCTALCDSEGRDTAALQLTSCYCLAEGRREFGSKASDDRHCSSRCPDDYFKGTDRFCGGSAGHFSAYQKYSFVHQTAQGCYDPRRFIWYQSVAIEVFEYDIKGKLVNYDMEWHLHAASINSGEPLFPYHQALEQLHLGLQYDLDSSRIVAYTVPPWGVKTKFDTWSPSVITYDVATVDDTVALTRKSIPFNFDPVDVANYQLGTGISAIDALHDIYYVAMPTIATDPGFELSCQHVECLKTKLYGINLKNSDDVLKAQTIDYPVVLLEVNTQSHELFAVLKEEHVDSDEESRFFYVLLGRSFRSNKTSSLDVLEFDWSFGVPMVAHAVNPYSYQDFVHKVYQIGATAVDHVSNTSFVVIKDSTRANDKIYIKDINQQGTLKTEAFTPISTPDVQATWLANTDPILPLSLPAPKLLYARFSMDGRSIYVRFDAKTVEGALPIDSDGDMLPDGIDWSKRQKGNRSCADMFTRSTAEMLGEYPSTYCEWRSGSEIQIQLASGNKDVNVGTGLFLKGKTVYAYVAAGSQWSMAASGGVNVNPPDPLLAPVVSVNYDKNVDLCSSVTLNAMSSYMHGDQPKWNWHLGSPITCIGNILPKPKYAERLTELMVARSIGGLNSPSTGSPRIEIGSDELQPGCEYPIVMNLTGRWGIATAKKFSVRKVPMPAPKVSMLSSRELKTTRRLGVVMQARVEQSDCEMMHSDGTKTPKFLWSGKVQEVNSFSGAVDEKPIEDLSVLTPLVESASLVIGKFMLEPDVTYTFTLRVGYAENWDVPGATTEEDVIVRMERSPIKVDVLGGSRQAMKNNLIVIDTTRSLDPDFPDDLVELNPNWNFEYSCRTPEGIPCFLLTSNEPVMREVKNCTLAIGATFEDLDHTYDLPSFSTALLRGDSYYCRHPTKQGLLIVNLPNENALPGGTIGNGNNYTLTVFANSFGRKATAIITISVITGCENNVGFPPEVVLDPVTAAKVVTTRELKISGSLISESKAQYGDNVVWGWTFLREETNSQYSFQDKEKAEAEGKVYWVPERVFNPAVELDANVNQDFAISTLTSNSLVLNVNVLRPSSTYAFRLSATPLDAEGPCASEGYGEIGFETAGPAPFPGTLVIEPEGGSYVTEPKQISAPEWTAEDAPVKYMFSYQWDLTEEKSKSTALRINPISSAEQKVWCMHAGFPGQNYSVKVTVEVYTIFGAMSKMSKDYVVRPPPDIQATNREIREKMKNSAPEDTAQIFACLDMNPLPAASTPSPSVPTDPPDVIDSLTAATSTSTLPPVQAPVVPISPEQEANELAAKKEEVDDIVNVLALSIDKAPATSALMVANLNALQRTTESYGVVTEDMGKLAEKVTDRVVELIGDEEDDQAVANLVNSVLDFVGGVFKTIAQLSSMREANAASATRGRRLTGETNTVTLPDEAFPDWKTLPARFRDPIYVEVPRGRHSYLTAPAVPSLDQPSGREWDDLEDAKEYFEKEWVAYMSARQKMEQTTKIQELQDEEQFANYSAHLLPDERETVMRRWWEEKARKDAKTNADLIARSRQTQQTLNIVNRVCQGLFPRMVDKEQKIFEFSIGTVLLGRSRNLKLAHNSFSLQEPRWTMDVNEKGSFGWQSIQFNFNPFSWSPNSVGGPFVVSTLDIYSDDGSHTEVDRQALPVGVMRDHPSFASASCKFWDWRANNGMGEWSSNGFVLDENGCSGTHLSVVGMFLDNTLPLLELTEAIEVSYAGEYQVGEDSEYTVVIIGVVAAIALILHYWGYKQDEVDILKLPKLKKLGDGVTGPITQDDPIFYSRLRVVRDAVTFWNILCRDHILVSLGCQCAKGRVTRLQKVAVFTASLTGTAAVSALLCGERVVNPVHFVEVGITAATLTYPLVGALSLIFQTKPVVEATIRKYSSQGVHDICDFGSIPAKKELVPIGVVPEQLASPAPREASKDTAGILQLNPTTDSEITAIAAALLEPIPLPGEILSPVLPPVPASIWNNVSPPPKSWGVLTPTPAPRSVPPSPPPRSVPPSPPPRSVPPSPPPKSLPPTPPPGSVPPAPPKISPTPPFGHPPATPPPGAELPSPSPSVVRERPAPPKLAAPSRGPVQFSKPPAPPGVASGIGRVTVPKPPGGKYSPAVTPTPPPGYDSLPGAVPSTLPPGVPIAGPRRVEPEVLAIVPNREAGGFSAPIATPPRHPPGAPPKGSSAAQVTLSHGQALMFQRLRRMYEEPSDVDGVRKPDYDSRLDSRALVNDKLARLANALAHATVTCYWVIAVGVVLAYVIYFNPMTADRWAHACLWGWIFSWFVLDVVKVALSTFHVIAEHRHRRCMANHQKLKDMSGLKLDQKRRRMEALGKASGLLPKLHPLMSRPPLPPDPPPDGSIPWNIPVVREIPAG